MIFLYFDLIAIAKVGCFKQNTIKGLQLVLNERSMIKWDKKGFTKFVNG